MTDRTLALIVSDLTTASVLLPFVVAVLLHRFLRGDMRVAALMVYLMAGHEFFQAYFQSLNLHDIPLQHFYMLAEFVVLSLLYLQVFEEEKWQKLIRWGVAFFLIFAFLNTFVFSGLMGYPNLPRIIQSSIFILYPLIYFRKILHQWHIFYVEREPLFWINIGILFYFSGSFFMLVFSWIFEMNPSGLASVFLIQSFLNIVLHVLWAIGLITSRNRETSAFSS